MKFFIVILSKVISLNSFLIGQLYWSHNCTAWSVINMSITIAQELYKIHNALSTMYRVANDKHTPKRKKNIQFEFWYSISQYAYHEKTKTTFKNPFKLVNKLLNQHLFMNFFHHGSLTKCMQLSKFNVLVVQLKLWDEHFCPEKLTNEKWWKKILKQLFIEKQ